MTADTPRLPIKRGTARRLGIHRPAPPEPLSFEQFGIALMAEIERDMRASLTTRYLGRRRV